MKKLILLIFFLPLISSSQGTWFFSNRTHPELNWKTITSKNFRIHYHTEIEEIAKKGIDISEAILPSLLKQVKLEKIGTIDITFTAEDEIMNGFANWNNNVVIWVDQNDAALWLEDEKWLTQVVSHELQHVVLLNSIKSWLPEPFGILLSGTPSWFIEGSAEYFTERWRPYRSDIKHKYSFLRNESDKMDPHDDGFSKLLYMSHRFGDSVIYSIVHNRNSVGVFFFDDAFKLKTGISVEQFNEEWRRDMSTSFFGYRAQKERYEDVGKIISLPLKKSFAFRLAEDSIHIAIIGEMDDWQMDKSLIIAEQETTQEKSFFQKIFSNKSKDSVKQAPKYLFKEIDNGEFHPSMDWSRNNQYLAYSKYHYDENQSMTYDIKIYDTKISESNWITSTVRATYPVFVPNKEEIIFVSHNNSVANLFLYDLKKKTKRKLTNFKAETEIITPSISSDGKQIAFALSQEDGNVNIALYNFETSKINIITRNPEAESRPIWSSDNKSITFTSHKGGTLNLHTINLENDSLKQITDVGDGISAVQQAPNSTLLISIILPEKDSAKLVLVDPNRIAKLTDLSMNPFYWDWKTAGSQIKLPKNFARQSNTQIEKYSLINNLKLYSWIVIPIIFSSSSGATGAFLLSDPMMRNIIGVTGQLTNGVEREQQILLSYINAMYWPLLSVEVGKNSTSKYRNYDQSLSGLNENVDLLKISGSIPSNFGDAMNSDHTFSFGIKFQKRSVESMYDKIENNKPVYRNKLENKILPIPENAEEGILLLKYRWLDKRPFTNVDWFPTQGKGLKVQFENANSKLFGNFNYTKITSDAYLNYPISKRLIFYGRVKSEILSGKAPSQDYIGITNDPASYYPWQTEDISSLIQYDENHSLRGWDNIRLGDRLIFGSIEIRFPIAEKLPLNIFGITIGSLSISSVNDFGNAWYSKSEIKPKIIITTGYEMKFALKFGDFALFNFAYGRAHPRHEPSKDEEYFRLSLINPY